MNNNQNWSGSNANRNSRGYQYNNFGNSSSRDTQGFGRDRQDFLEYRLTPRYMDRMLYGRSDGAGRDDKLIETFRRVNRIEEMPLHFCLRCLRSHPVSAHRFSINPMRNREMGDVYVPTEADYNALSLLYNYLKSKNL